VVQCGAPYQVRLKDDAARSNHANRDQKRG
jgi:hypothetical protein